MNSVYETGPGRGPKDRERRENDRDALVATARQLILEKGLRNLSGREIAKAAGFSPALINRIFGSLDNLIVAANFPTLVALGEHLSQSDRPDADVGVRLLALTDAYIDFAEREGLLWAALFEHHVDAAPDAVATELARLFSILERILTDARIAEDQRPLLAKALWSGVHGIVYLGQTGGLGPVGPESVREMAHLLVRTMANGLKDPPS